jgi:putative redox protein
MKSLITWRQDAGPGLSFSGTADSGFSMELAGSGGEGLRPMELLLISLAGCTSIDVIGILQKKRQTLTGFEVQVEGERAAEHPRVFTHIRVHYLVSGNVSPKAIERAIELSKNKYCSVSAMLHQAAEIECTYEIINEPAPTEPAATLEN